MKTIVHISDLHFGKNDDRHVGDVLRACKKIRPDIVVISGDFTQRAKETEFQMAQDFIKAIKRLGITTVLAIPGNHDIRPHHQVLRRALTPYDRYQDFIAPHTVTHFRARDVAICGVNTVRARKFKDGHISDSDIDEAVQWFSKVPKSAVRIVVTHHPLDLPSNFPKRKLTARSNAAIPVLAESNVSMYLSGHYHRSSVVSTRERYADGTYAAIAVQAGTVSLRGRGEAPSFNVLSIAGRRIVVTTYTYGENEFSLVSSREFVKKKSEWTG